MAMKKGYFCNIILLLMNYETVLTQYFHWIDEIDGIKIGVFLLKDKKQKADYYLTQISEIIRFLKNEIYGMYPY